MSPSSHEGSESIMSLIATVEELRTIDAFKEIHPDSLIEISRIAHRIHLKKEGVLFHEKDRITKIYAVLTGKVALSRNSSSGQKRVFFILSEGSLVNEVVFDDLPVSVVCEGFEDSCILEFEKTAFLKIMEKDFKLTMNILNSIGRKERRLYRQLKNTLPIKMDKRLAAKLWKLSKDHGVQVGDWRRIELNISVTYLSYMLGSTRETISRAMSTLLEAGVIRWEDKKMLADEEALLTYYRGTSLSKP